MDASLRACQWQLPQSKRRSGPFLSVDLRLGPDGLDGAGQHGVFARKVITTRLVLARAELERLGLVVAERARHPPASPWWS
jgi:hypothetical protein